VKLNKPEPPVDPELLEMINQYLDENLEADD